MIRVRKSEDVPASLLLANPIAYDGQDVQAALVIDQDEKCYLCEQQHRQNFQVEHLKPKTIYTRLKYTWTNLFSACPYCNGRKPNDYEILDPSQHNIEDILVQKLDLVNKHIEINTLTPGSQEEFTVKLLKKLFNGKNNIRDIKGQRLYDDLQREVIFFLKLLNDYKNENTPDNKQKIIDHLDIKKEYLAFKYWLLKENHFYDEFESNVVWNKVERILNELKDK
ncbi:HNH endonuclease [Pedobacter sp. R20-19]|uniref:HNH endonuclease n=1 Tax=Pedobacter sp. R20-19 TaxID=1270196 RepID=UPI00049370A6|nr:HNH endonuclease [Pedobacter sp. R20-19]